jgi:class 3 adenylate cyclase
VRAEILPAHEARKTVTVVFTDLVGSTALGERLDAEALREVMDRYFSEMRAVLERHGGVVEKYIGDAIMGVFGLPRVHEDDALRAVRDAWEMRHGRVGLNRELDEGWGVTLATRTGCTRGPVTLPVPKKTSPLLSTSSSAQPRSSRTEGPTVSSYLCTSLRHSSREGISTMRTRY